MKVKKMKPGAIWPGLFNKTKKKGGFMKARCVTKLDILVKSQTMKEKLQSRRNKKYSKRIPSNSTAASFESLDDLIERDNKREKDGFQKKIKIGKILAGAGKVIMVPYVVEEKLIHGEFEPTEENKGSVAGHGDGEIGDVVDEESLFGDGDGEGDDDGGDGAGQGDGGEHGIEAEAFKFGKELSEKFQLPNLKDKGKKVPTQEYVYDLTDRHVGSGQLLDKKETLKQIVKSNMALGIIDKENVDTSKLIVGPQDKIYRVLSREKIWKSQAVVFFLRDYSGSMDGDPTKAVVSQHLMIYSWLLTQYDKLVVPRFIVHDHGSKEVTVQDYFRKRAGGGTLIASGYRKINEIVEGEGLARDYNIYVFQGTDGDDGDNGEQAIPELEKIMKYVNRMGVSILRHPYYLDQDTVFESYIQIAGLVERKELFRMHLIMSDEVTDEKNIEAVKALIAQD